MKNIYYKLLQNKHTLILTIITIVVLIILGNYFYSFIINKFKNEKLNELKTITKFKIEQISQWYKERLDDVKVISSTPFFIRGVEVWLKNMSSIALKEDILKIFNSAKTNYGYEDIFLISKRGDILISTNPILHKIDSTTLLKIAEISQKNLDYLVHLYYSHLHKKPYLDIICPIKNERNVIIAKMIFRVNPQDYIFPLIKSWPTDSKSAELVMVKRDGDSVLYLSELRHRNITATNFRLPLSKTELPDVQAILGKTGIFEGRDYRDAEVIAFIPPRVAPNLFLYTKVDKEEIFAEIRNASTVFIIIILLLLISSIIGISLIYYNRQRKVQKNLVQLQEEYKATFYSIGDAVITTDINGLVVKMNSVAEKLCGWTQAEAQGKPLNQVFKIINAVSRQQVTNPVEMVLEKGKIVGLANHTILISKDGSEYHISDSAAPIKTKEGEIIGVVLVFSDITEKYNVQMALQESEQRFKIVALHTGQLIYEWNLETGKIIWSGAIENVTGYSFEEFNNTINFNGWLYLCHPDDRDSVNELLKKAANSSTGNYVVNYRFLRKDGNYIHIEDRGTYIFDNNGKPYKSYGTMIDITNQKLTEEKIKNQLERTTLLFNLLDYVSKAESLDTVYKKAVDSIIHSLNADASSLLLFDKNGVMKFASWINLSDEYRNAVEGHSPWAPDCKNPQAIFVENTLEEPALKDFLQIILKEGILAMAFIPLVAEDKLIGKFMIYFKKPYLFNEEDQNYLKTIGTTIAFSICQKKNTEALIESKQSLEQQFKFSQSLNKISQIILSENDPLIILEESNKIIGETLKVDRCTIFRVDLGKRVAYGLYEWLNPQIENITPTIADFPIDLFYESEKYITKTHKWIESHVDNVNKLFELEGTQKLLHEDMQAKSILWFPFGFTENQYFLLAFDNVVALHKWQETEIKFIESCAKQMELAFMKINFVTELQKSEKKLLSFFEEDIAANFLVTANGKLMFCNNTFIKLFGFSSEEEALKYPAEKYYSNPLERKNFLNLLKEKKSIYNQEKQYLTKDGRKIFVIQNSFGEFDNNGELIQIKGYIVDITDRKIIEESLRKISYAIEYSYSSIVITNKQGSIEYVNESLCTLTGYSKDELLGKNTRIFKSGYHNREYYKDMWDTILSGKTWQGEIKNKKKNRELYWEKQTISPIFDKQGNITHFVSIKEDITEKKKMLENLIAAKELAEQSNKLKDAFIANISHEIRSPLTGLLGMISIIKEIFEEYITENEQTYFESIDLASKRLIRTVDMILNYSQLQSGLFKSKPRFIDVNTICMNLINEYKIKAQRKSLQIYFENKTNNTIIWADEFCITQSISNLLDNAIKYTKTGFVKVTIYNDENENLLLDVQDTGIGITEESQLYIFEPYRQEEMGYGRSYEGVGLGLALVKNFLALNNATISVKSKKGEGATFTINFGILTNKGNSQINTEISHQISQKINGTFSTGKNKPTILLVEDDETNRLTLRKYLQVNFKLLETGNSDEVFEILNNNNIDIILMDISIMGSKNGLELTSEIKKQNKFKNIPVIAITAYAFEKDKENALAAGCDEYIAKPFSKEELIKKISKFL